MRLLRSAILVAVIAFQSSASPSLTKRQATQLHWEGQRGPQGILLPSIENKSPQPVSLNQPIDLASLSQNTQVNQVAPNQILNQFQPNAQLYKGFQPQLLQPTQLNYNYNPFNPASFYITNPNPNPTGTKVQQEETSSAEVTPVQHSSVVNHGSYNPFESRSISPAPLPVQYKRPQNYAPTLQAVPQAHFVPQKLPRYQSKPQQGLVTPNQYNFAPQRPNSYNFQQPQPQKPRVNNAPLHHPLSAVLNPYQPRRAPPAPSSTPVPFHARPQVFQTVVQKEKPNTTPSRNTPRDEVKNEREEESEDAREIDDREDDEDDASKEEYNYRDEDDSDEIDEVDSREYRPTFQAARYIFNRAGESEEDEDSSSSNIYPKNTKHYKYDDNPFGKHYGNEHKKYLARYKKSKYYKPKKNKELDYELEGKPSQYVPVAVRNRKLVEEKWLVTKKEQS